MRPIKLSATGFAEFVGASPDSKLRKLRPFKYPHKGEGAGRSGYYKRTIDTVREYHRAGNDLTIIRRAIESLLALEDNISLSRQARTKARRNANALLAYEDLYGNRRFTVLPNHRLALTVKGITITAAPHLWVEENGFQVLIKIGVAKYKTPDYIDLLLHLIRKAAVASRHRVRARNVVYLNITTGEEVVSNRPLSYFNRTLGRAAAEISEKWDLVTPPQESPKKATT